MNGVAPLAWAGAGALVAGFAASPHCALMCGPLACMAGGAGRTGLRGAAAWHTARLAAYAALGALLGGAGAGVGALLSLRLEPYLPWVMATALVATAFDATRRLQALPLVGRLFGAAARAAAGLPLGTRTAALGALTPFVPCGLLYTAFVAAAAAGSVGRGALVMALFGAGAVPALAAAQAGAALFRGNARRLRLLRTALPLVAAAVLVWRAVTAAAPGAPACH